MCGACFAFGSIVGAQELPVLVETGEALSVACDRDLAFGTIGISASSNGGDVTVAAASGASAGSGSNNGLSTSGMSHSARCSITAPEDSTVEISLSGGGGSFSNGTLSGATLQGPDDNTLPVQLQLSHTSGTNVGSQSTDPGPVHVGGTLTLPARSSASFGTYSREFTITVVTE